MSLPIQPRKRAEVIWVPKGTGGFRPISLLPVLGRVLDRLLAERINAHMEVSGAFSDAQYGFRSGRSAIEAIGGVVDRMKGNRAAGMHSLVVALDLTNAFGMAWGPAVGRMLRKCGVDEDVGRLARSFMQGRLVMLEDIEWQAERGCPQGSSLGPTLWITLMEGWFQCMKGLECMGVHVQAYADDQVVVVSGRSVRELEKRWKEVWLTCSEWADANKLCYNISKTEAMFVSTGKEIREPVIVMEGVRVGLGTSVKYLGVRIDRKLCWLEHVKSVRQRVQEVAIKFFALSRRRWGSKPATLKIIYERAVAPMVIYGAEIWGEKVMDTRMRRHLRAIERPYLRAITGAYSTAPVEALAVLAGCVPLQVRVRSQYEGWNDWRVRLGEEKIRTNERVHPALRGYMPVREDGMNEVIVYTDATLEQGNLASAVGWAIDDAPTGWLVGGTRCKGGSDVNVLEAKGILEAIGAGREYGLGRFREGNNLVQIGIKTDSQKAIRWIREGKPACRVANDIQVQIARGLSTGFRIIIEWERKGSEGNRRAEAAAKEVLGNDNTMEVELSWGFKREFREWVRTREMSLWQDRWETDETGRGLYSMMGRVQRDGIVKGLTRKMTQILTGHGNFAGYLKRFGLRSEGGCSCGGGDETHLHVLRDCGLEGRVRARRVLEDLLGVYPSDLNVVSGRWDRLVAWAEDMVADEDDL